jgi:hypothetical protein
MSRLWILTGAFVVTATTLALALVLGSWGFDYRRYSQHEGRLQRALEQRPSLEQLTAGLAEEGASVFSAPATAEEVERVVAAHGGKRAGELRRRARRWPRLQVFQAADMLYFVFFDDGDVMRDFTLVSRR